MSRILFFLMCESFEYVENILLEVTAASMSFYFTFTVNCYWLNRTTRNNQGDPKYTTLIMTSIFLFKYANIFSDFSIELCIIMQSKFIHIILSDKQ
jgi:hypothetical protein